MSVIHYTRKGSKTFCGRGPKPSDRSGWLHEVTCVTCLVRSVEVAAKQAREDDTYDPLYRLRTNRLHAVRGRKISR